MESQSLTTNAIVVEDKPKILRKGTLTAGLVASALLIGMGGFVTQRASAQYQGLGAESSMDFLSTTEGNMDKLASMVSEDPHLSSDLAAVKVQAADSNELLFRDCAMAGYEASSLEIFDTCARDHGLPTSSMDQFAKDIATDLLAKAEKNPEIKELALGVYEGYILPVKDSTKIGESLDQTLVETQETQVLGYIDLFFAVASSVAMCFGSQLCK